MDNIPLNGAVIVEPYQPITGCESDDSRSSISRSDDTEPVPSIIYTSDDSADAALPHSAYVDSTGPTYIAQNVFQGMEDDTSVQLLLHSGCPTPHPNDFLDHHLPNGIFSKSEDLPVTEDKLVIGVNKKLSERANLQTNPDIPFARITSVSSTSSDVNPEANNLLPDYRPLSGYSDDFTGLSFNALNTDSVKASIMQEQLDKLVDKESSIKQCPISRHLVGDVHVDGKYKDAFFMSWNWDKIRSTCTFIQVSLIVALFCVSIGLLINMPRGSECDPQQSWWQGNVAYHIFVPSFKDTDNDGIGDINGIINKLDYIQHKIGAKIVTLSPLFESDQLIAPKVRNYTKVSSLFGTQNDFHLLSVLLHQRGMHLIMDFPLTFVHPNMYHIDEEQDIAEPLFMKRLETVYYDDLSDILEYWLNLGVDGFSFVDLHLLTNKTDLHDKVQQWRNTLDRHSTLTPPIMMVPSKLLDKLDNKGSVYVHHLISLIDLIDVNLDLTISGEEILETIKNGTIRGTHPSMPWINWNIGAPGRPRLSQYSNESDLGSSLFLLTLPGTITMYYGDEVTLKGIDYSGKKDLSWAAMMQWTEGKNSGFSSAEPWVKNNEEWLERNTVCFNDTLIMINTLVNTRLTKAPLYVDGIFKEKDGKMKKETNFKVRYNKEGLLAFERNYPRRQNYAVIANFGVEEKEVNLSDLYYAGEIIASSSNNQGYYKFEETVLKSREVLIYVLDM